MIWNARLWPSSRRPKRHRRGSTLATLLQRQVLVMVGIDSCFIFGSIGMVFWLPTVLATHAHSSNLVGLHALHSSIHLLCVNRDGDVFTAFRQKPPAAHPCGHFPCRR